MNSREEIKSAVHVINPNKNVVESLEVRYDIYGKSDEDKKKKLTDADAAAIAVKIGNSVTYKVKGSKSGKLYDPANNGPIAAEVGGTKKFKFFEVTNRSFDTYLQFLRTGHNNLLKKAERE